MATIQPQQKNVHLGTPDLYWDREVCSGFIELVDEDKYGISLNRIITRLEKGLSVFKDDVLIFVVETDAYNENLRIIMNNLPTSSDFLESGQIWNDNGTLKIVR